MGTRSSAVHTVDGAMVFLHHRGLAEPSDVFCRRYNDREKELQHHALAAQVSEIVLPPKTEQGAPTCFVLG